MGTKGGVFMKKQERFMQNGETINCPKCKSYRLVTNGKHANGAQRYRCNACGARFNENTWKNNLTEKEFFANEFLRYLFGAKKEYFNDAQKIHVKIDTKMIAQEVLEKIKKIKNDEENEVLKKFFNETFKFFNICTLPANVATPENDWRPHKEYYISEGSKDFLIMLKGFNNNIYFINQMPEVKCRNVTLETPEYIINIQRKGDLPREKALYQEKFMEARKAQENKQKKKKT